MAQPELQPHTQGLTMRQNNNGKIKNCCNPRGLTSQAGLTLLSAKPPSHRCGQGKKHPKISFSTGVTPTAPRAGTVPWVSPLPQDKGHLWPQSQTCSWGRINQISKTEGQASPQSLPHSALWGLQQEKCAAAAVSGSKRFTQWGKKKQLKIKKL